MGVIYLWTLEGNEMEEVERGIWWISGKKGWGQYVVEVLVGWELDRYNIVGSVGKDKQNQKTV